MSLLSSHDFWKFAERDREGNLGNEEDRIRDCGFPVCVSVCADRAKEEEELGKGRNGKIKTGLEI